MRLSTRLLLLACAVCATVPMIVFISRSHTQKNWKDMETVTSGLSLVSDPKQWQRHIHDACADLKLVQSSNTPLDPQKFKKFLVDDKHKMLYCQIPKVATTTWRRILIYLSGRLNVSDPLKISANDAHHKYDDMLTYLSDFPKEEIQHRLDSYFKFVIVREPYERLLSAFRNKFETNTSSAKYFRKAFGVNIINTFRNNPSHQSLGSANDLKFDEFVQYLIDPERKIKMNEHWERFYKLCHPCLINYDFIGKLETIEQDSQHILEKTGASALVKFPSRSESRYSYKKTNSYVVDYFSRIPRDDLLQLHKMYTADFHIFNYSIPDAIQVLF